jgi:hypothetical protein
MASGISTILSSQAPVQYPQFTESALYYDISFNESGNPIPRPPYSAGNTLRENYTRRRLLDADSDIPDGHPLPVS